jgi:hypothetical protein
MDKETFLNLHKELKGKTTIYNFYARQAELKNLIQLYAGKNNPFYEATEKVKITAPFAEDYLDNIFNSFYKSVEKDLISKISFERKIKTEVLSDYLSQAEEPLELEEFLRNWVSEEISDFAQKPSIDSYAKALRTKELITKQDLKEINVWGGYRNDAAHGNWKAVEDRDKITMMLKGVALFIKQYSS